ncbi:hypothetical protein OUZ56_000629 [Daphnia magna]|uniref:Uncharacterized protein n=1 Tax=Daphnia magna TaxID=35525 RepID=A0ABR0A097_9CRUS|nr:hypothetical protein OUZ56_000629 [Daphnia magna]
MLENMIHLGLGHGSRKPGLPAVRRQKKSAMSDPGSLFAKLIATYLGLSWVFNIVVPRVAKTNNIRVCNAHFVLGKPF